MPSLGYARKAKRNPTNRNPYFTPIYKSLQEKERAKQQQGLSAAPEPGASPPVQPQPNPANLGGVGRAYNSADRNPAAAVGQGRPVDNPQAELSQNEQPGLGHQLSRRVASGEIDRGKAAQTNAEREMLENAFGKDWRIHVYGSRGLAQRTRQALAQNPNDPTYQALYKRLMEDRKRALERAGVMLQEQGSGGL